MRYILTSSLCIGAAFALAGCNPAPARGSALNGELSGGASAAPPPGGSDARTASSAAGAAPSRFTPQSPYPPAAWRRASPNDMRKVVLWPSHLLIRYAGVENATSVSFVLADFHSVLPPATRTREQALALVTELAEQARAEPERFADLVREHSEDIVRRDRGGSLGGIPATQLAPWPELLDALSQLKPGDISLPVETRYGFHILRRRAPPEPDTVTGRRIVIGHEQAQFLRTLTGGVAPTRTRADALALAARIHAEASARPDLFPELVQRYSELRDRVVGGDFGTWSNRELSPFPGEVEVLDGLQVGEVSAPFDSLFGIQVVQRVPNRERPEYAIDGLELNFDPREPAEGPSSQPSVLAQARALNQRLLETPSLLPELQSKHPPFTSQWIEGRGSPELTAALASLQPGDLLGEPVRTAQRYVIGRRAVALPSISVPPSFELPGS